LGVLGFPDGSGTGGAAVLQWETRWFAGGARALEDNVVWCKSPVRWRVVSCLRDGAWSTEHGGCWAGARRLQSGTADGGDCRGGGSRDSGVVGSRGGAVRSLFRVSRGSSWRQLVSLLKWRRALRVFSFHGLV